jgi:AcrR family transcriptional regulator
MEMGLRERKKQRTKRAVMDIALRLFAEQGFDATTVEEICAEAEISPSTFFRYFPTKEAAAFPDEEARIAVVESVLRERPADEPLHATIRRSALMLVDHDLDAKGDFEARLELMAREPAILAYATRTQNEAAEIFTKILAEQLGLDPGIDLRPRLIVSAAFAAVGSAWTAWVNGEAGGDLRSLVNEAFDLIDAGLSALHIDEHAAASSRT